MLLEPFLRQCQQQPKALALIEAELSLSYGDLLERANSFAHALQNNGVMPGHRVAIHLERGIDAVTAVFGTLLAGACYVPLDLKNPHPRLAFIINDAHIAAMVGRGSPPPWLTGYPWLDVTACPSGQPKTTQAEPGTLAAILYTSGSTGKPKGVALSHAALATFKEWAADLLELDAEDRIASSTPFFFDLSTFDLYAVLGRGASLYFVSTALTMVPARLSSWLKEHAITGWYTVPSLLAFIAYKGNLGQTPLPTMRFLIFAGEVFPTPALINLAEFLPSTTLYNFFGPTETNVCCYWPVDRERLNPNQSIPIGFPTAGNELHIDGTTGELWVRGTTLASGYWGEGQLHSFLNETGWHATGDRVSVNENGEYLFHGRLGRMLKCSGYRVEPAEIEATVSAVSGVNACAVVGVDDPTAGQRPALVVELAETLSLSDLRQALLRQLPTYMQPCRYWVVDALPRLPNGKLDYQRLRSFMELQ